MRGYADNLVDLAALRELLYDLSHGQSQISIRLQVKGKPLEDYFANVLVFAKHAILLAHMPTRTVINITDLDEVVAFEIDKNHKDLQAHEVYYIKHHQSVMHS